MSTKRIIIITALSGLLIVAVVAVMLISMFLRQEPDPIKLPGATVTSERPNTAEPDALDRVVVAPETIQAVVSSLDRPSAYRRNVIIDYFWDGGHAEFNIVVTVANGMTSISSLPSIGAEKRIIITPDTLYIWNRGDATPYTGAINSAGDGYRTADEWQMMDTYEDLLSLDMNEIIEAGYTDYEGKECIYAVHRSPLLGNIRKYYISLDIPLDIGLVVAAEEHNAAGDLIYRMRVGEFALDESDPAAFTLPDGTNLLES